MDIPDIQSRNRAAQKTTNGGGGLRVGIVGGGFTGAMLAVHLLHEANDGLELFLIERSPVVGRGLAYSTQNPEHLLNVRVANMSAFDDDPAHFLKWLWAKDAPTANKINIPPSGLAFVSRQTYGAYIENVFAEAVERRAEGTTVTTVQAQALDLTAGTRPILTLGDGRCLELDYVVLCVGTFPPAPPPGLSEAARLSPRYMSDPWDAARLQTIKRDEKVVIIGSGLTMVDVILGLRARGHEGPIEVLSRRGLIPLRHEQTRRYVPETTLIAQPLSALSLLRSLREDVRRAAVQGFDWRCVIDGLRPHTRRLWTRLTLPERERFLRHLRPYWDIHRHRVAPKVADILDDLQKSGQLTVRPARISSVHATPTGFDVIARYRGEADAQMTDAPWLINCSGPRCDNTGIADPLLQSLLRRGAARPDPLHLGLDVTEDCALVQTDGTPHDRIFALGPPTRGAFWEVTSVPDIRSACRTFASTLLHRINAMPVFRTAAQTASPDDAGCYG